jgi:S1-C subfamily serine protease
VLIAVTLWSLVSNVPQPITPPKSALPAVQSANITPRTKIVKSSAVAGESVKSPPGQWSWTKVVEPCKASVVLIRVLRADNAVATGSGFFVRDGRTIVTNYHVVERAESGIAQLSDGTTVPIAGFLALVPGQDLAVLRLDHSVDPAKPMTLSDSLPAIGAQVLALGAPKGLAGSVSDGIVGGVRTGDELEMAIDGRYSVETLYAPDTEWLQISAPISEGNSGGPLLDVNGNVVGVSTFSILRGSQNLNFAVSVRHIKQVLATLADKAMPLASQPVPAKTKAEIAAEAEQIASAEAEKALIAKANEDRKRAIAAIESARLSRERQDELQQLSDQAVQLRSELSRIESDGVGLQARHDQAVAQGKAVFLVGTQIARRSAIALTQLGDLEGCVRRRQAVVNGLLAVLDNHPAPYDAAGLAQVRAEYTIKASEVAALRTEATVAEASFVKLDQETRSLAVQLKYLADQRESTRAELKRLLDRQAVLQGENR